MKLLGRRDQYARRKDQLIRCRIFKKKLKYGSFKCHLRTSHLGNEADLRTLEQARHAPNNTQVMQQLLELHSLILIAHTSKRPTFSILSLSYLKYIEGLVTDHKAILPLLRGTKRPIQGVKCNVQALRILFHP